MEKAPVKKIDKSKIKTWFVTGASTGVGHEICRQLLDRNYNVIAVARRIPDFKHPNALCVSVDVTKPEEIENAVKMGIEKFGTIDVLSNNAGVSATITLEEETFEHMRDVMEVNYWGTFNTIYKILPHFRKNKNGTIINNTSMHGLLSRYRGAAYCSSKFAIEGLTGVVRIEAKLRDFYGSPSYKIKNNLKIAVKNIINEVENEKMHHRLMLGDDCLHRVNKEMEIRREDWLYSKECIPSSSEIIPDTNKQNNNKAKKNKKFIQKVFSLTNEYSNDKKKRKVLTILGVKMKFLVSK